MEYGMKNGKIKITEINICQGGGGGGRGGGAMAPLTCGIHHIFHCHHNAPPPPPPQYLWNWNEEYENFYNSGLVGRGVDRGRKSCFGGCPNCTCTYGGHMYWKLPLYNHYFFPSCRGGNEVVALGRSRGQGLVPMGEGGCIWGYWNEQEE